MATANRYSRLIEAIFLARYQPGVDVVPFAREDVSAQAAQLGINLPKNLGDVIYSFRFRIPLPDPILATQPAGYEWLIKLQGKGQYAFVLEPELRIVPSSNYAETKLLDATPGMIRHYALNDEQALLAILRYNRLIDTFLSLTCYSLQNHLRTTVPNMGQVETDEVYVGVDVSGVHFVVPVQAKGGRDKQGKVQIEQDIALCQHKFPDLVCRPVAAQFMADGVIAMFAFEFTADIRILQEKHYRLVPPSELTKEELRAYQRRP